MAGRFLRFIGAGTLALTVLVGLVKHEWGYLVAWLVLTWWAFGRSYLARRAYVKRWRGIARILDSEWKRK